MTKALPISRKKIVTAGDLQNFMYDHPWKRTFLKCAVIFNIGNTYFGRNCTFPKDTTISVGQINAKISITLLLGQQNKR